MSPLDRIANVSTLKVKLMSCHFRLRKWKLQCTFVHQTPLCFIRHMTSTNSIKWNTNPSSARQISERIHTNCFWMKTRTYMSSLCNNVLTFFSSGFAFSSGREYKQWNGYVVSLWTALLICLSCSTIIQLFSQRKNTNTPMCSFPFRCSECGQGSRTMSKIQNHIYPSEGLLHF